MIDHVNALVLPVRDVENCATFYRDKLGFKLNEINDEAAFLAIGDKSKIVLALISINEVARLISDEQVQPREESIHRTYYAVFVEDVDSEYEELKSKGVHFVKPPITHPWGQRIA